MEYGGGRGKFTIGRVLFQRTDTDEKYFFKEVSINTKEEKEGVGRDIMQARKHVQASERAHLLIGMRILLRRVLLLLLSLHEFKDGAWLCQSLFRYVFGEREQLFRFILRRGYVCRVNVGNVFWRRKVAQNDS